MNGTARRPLNGPVGDDLAAKDTPGIAAHDARWAAVVLAGRARDVAELRTLLYMTGLLAEPVRAAWQRTGAPS